MHSENISKSLPKLQVVKKYQLHHVANSDHVAFNAAVANYTALLVAMRHFSAKVLSKQHVSNFRNVTLLLVI